MGRKSKSDERQKEILLAFYETVKEFGIAKASFARIAARMDVNASLLVHYFSSKEEMEEAMVDHLLDKFQGDFLPAVEALDSPLERVKLTIFGIFSLDWLAKVDPDVFYSFYVHIFRNEHLRSKFQNLYKVFEDYLVMFLTQAKEAKVIDQSIHPKNFAAMLVIMQEGNNYYQHLMKGKVKGREIAEHNMAMMYKLLGISI